MKLFSGSANVKLSDEVSKLLKIPLAKVEIIRFGNSEVRVTIQEDVKNENCVVIQPTANPTDTNLMEFFFFSDALRRQEARRIIGVIPYFGYARQDVQHRPGECVSVNVVIRFIEAIGFHKIYTIDLHDETTEGVFSTPFKNLTALGLLASKIKKYLGSVGSENEIAIVSPDQGGVERARKFAQFFTDAPDTPLVIIEKQRDLQKTHRSSAIGLYGDIKNKTAIIVDDIVTSGGTLIHATELCLERGAKRVLVAIIHHDFSENAPEKLQNSPIEKFFTTNTIALKENQKFPKLVEYSVAPEIVKALKS